MIDARRRKELTKLLERLIPLPLLAKVDSSDRINWELVDQALVHPTYSASYNNDHLELLGDSVLKLAVSLFLRETYSSSSVGEMSRLRSHLVSDRVLAQIADGYSLDRFLVMTESARRDVRSVRSRLADALEALLAALYLSTNDLSLIRPWLDTHWERLAQDLQTDPTLGNYKAALQELTQGYWKQLPEYRSIEITIQIPTQISTSASHREPIFGSEVWLQGRAWGRGQGSSIKSAQQSAAAQALQAISEHLADLKPS